MQSIVESLIKTTLTKFICATNYFIAKIFTAVLGLEDNDNQWANTLREVLVSLGRT